MSAPIYPWATWCDGETHVARWGYEYFIKQEWFRRALHDKASRMGMRVSVHVINNRDIEFRFMSREEELV